MVPRLLNRVFNQVTNQVKGSTIKSYLLTKALAAKREEIKKYHYSYYHFRLYFSFCLNTK
jgi:hypothetical protein